MSAHLGYGTDGAMEHYRAAFSLREAHFPGGGLDWARQRRRHAMEVFQRTRFPSSSWEKWKHVPVDAITKPLYGFPARESSLGESVLPETDRAALEAVYLLDADAHRQTHRLVFLNGHFAPHLSRIGKLPNGAVAGSLAESLANSFALPDEAPAAALKYHLGRYIRTPYSGFAVLNDALFADGAFIYLPPGAVMEAPVHLVFASIFGIDPIMTLPRVLIVAEESSAVDVVESFASLGEIGDAPCFTNAVTEIALGPNAGVNHCKLQTEDERAALHVALLAAHQARDSRFVSHSVSAGARIARNDIESILDAEGCESTLDGLYLAGGRQYVDYYTYADHMKSHSASTQRYKGILAGKSRGVFNGKVHIYPDAQHIDARQRNENLLLSKDAQVDTRPELDIFADDVQCVHGATVGQLDENMLFYLRARGIAAEDAENLLTYGFAREIIERAPIAAVREKLTGSVLTHALDGKFADLEQAMVF